MTIASLPTLKVTIDPPPKDERSEYEQSRRINLIRSSQTAIDDAVRWKGLLDDLIYSSQVELAEALGLKAPQVSKILKINDIPEKLLKIMIEHPSTRTASNAYQISQIFRSEKFANSPEEAEVLAEEIIESIKNERTSKDNVEALIKSKMEGPKQRVRGEVESIRFGDVKGTLKVFPSRGQIDLSFRDLPEARVALLKQKIEQMLRSE
jgi:ParB family chromosome partitioning protein